MLQRREINFSTCRSFPTEIEDYYCMACWQPCSALSLLVGAHTNHQRKKLDDALDTLPHDFLMEALEFAKCTDVVTACSGDGSTPLLIPSSIRQERAALQSELSSIETQLEQLQQRREMIDVELRAVRENEVAAVAEWKRKVDELLGIGYGQLRSLNEIRPFYDGSRSSSSVRDDASLGELEKIEGMLRQDLRRLVEVQQLPAAAACSCDVSFAADSIGVGVVGGEGGQQQHPLPVRQTTPPPPPSSQFFVQRREYNVASIPRPVSPSRNSAGRDCLIARVLQGCHHHHRQSSERCGSHHSPPGGGGGINDDGAAEEY